MFSHFTKKYLILIYIFILCANCFGQNSPDCIFVQDIVPKQLKGNCEPLPWEFEKGDTIVLNSKYFNNFKSKPKALFFNKSYLREPDKNEMRVIKKWSDRSGMNRYIINDAELLLVYNRNIYKLSLDTVIYYRNWHKIDNQKAEESIKTYGYFPEFNLSDENNKVVYNMSPNRANEIDKLYLKYPLLDTANDKGVQPIDLELLKGEKLIVSWIKWNGSTLNLLLRTSDSKTFVVNSAKSTQLWSDNAYFRGYRYLVNDEYSVIIDDKLNNKIEDRNKFNDTLFEVKKLKLTTENNLDSYFTIEKVLFKRNDIYYSIKYFDRNDKVIKDDTIDSKVMLFEFDCYSKNHKTHLNSGQKEKDIKTEKKGIGNGSFIPDIINGDKLLSGKRSQKFFETLLPEFIKIDDYSISYSYNEKTQEHDILNETVTRYSFSYKSQYSIILLLGISRDGFIKSIEYDYPDGQHFYNFDRQLIKLGYNFNERLTQIVIKLGGQTLGEYVNAADHCLSYKSKTRYRLSK